MVNVAGGQPILPAGLRSEIKVSLPPCLGVATLVACAAAVVFPAFAVGDVAGVVVF